MNTLTENELLEICGGGDMPVASWPAQPYVPAGPGIGWGPSGIAGGRNSQPPHVSD
jgi:hypothetical protein